MSTSDVLERLEDIVPFVGGRALKKQQYEIYARVPKAETTACAIRILHPLSNRSEIFCSRPKEGKYSKEDEKENLRIMGILSRLPHQQQASLTAPASQMPNVDMQQMMTQYMHQYMAQLGPSMLQQQSQSLNTAALPAQGQRFGHAAPTMNQLAPGTTNTPAKDGSAPRKRKGTQGDDEMERGEEGNEGQEDENGVDPNGSTLSQPLAAKRLRGRPPASKTKVASGGKKNTKVK